MDTRDIIWRLAHLASQPYQERYVLGGTVDQYVLVTDVLEDIDSLKHLLERPENRCTITDVQMVALKGLFSCVDQHAGEALADKATKAEWEVFVRESEVWHALRAKAACTLRSFGVSEDMSIEEIDRLSK